MTSQADKVVWDQVAVPQTAATVYEAMHKRRMAWKFQDKAVPREAMERMLTAAVWAPNHRNNEPWRFFITDRGTPARQKLADVVFAGLMEEWKSERRAAPYRDKLIEAPSLIYVYHLADEDWFVEKENYAATVAAMQNISLAGYAEGLSVTWDTGRVTRVPAVDEVLGADDTMKLLAALTVGYPDEESQASRTPVGEYARWL
ncbi:MAG: nitroreductase family protein [Dehalococcoidia bacterium]